MAATARLDERGVARAEHHRGRRDTEPFGDKLRKCGFVALTGALRSNDHLDRSVGTNQDFGPLAWGATGRFDIVSDSDSAAQATRTRRLAPRRKAGPIGQVECYPHYAFIIAIVVDDAEWIAIGLLRWSDDITAAQGYPLEPALPRGQIDETF